MANINDPGMVGNERSAIGNDGMIMSAVNKLKAVREARALGKEMGEGFLEATRKGGQSGGTQTGGPSGTANQTTTGTKMVGNVVQAFQGAKELADTPGGAIGKTRMAATMLKAGGASAAAVGIGAVVAGTNMAINAANARFDRGRGDVLSKDRMAVQFQQMQGISQMDVSSRYRMPLTQYRLGAGGDLALMQMEAQTGLSALGQASSVEALRTLSGYQMSAGEAAGSVASLASAPTVNRMFMMTGTSLIGPGGTQRSGMSVIQNLARQAGLTNERVIKDALLPGSVTRSRLRSMGVPEEMVTQVIQYAKSNIAYKKQGGQGMYDPSREKDRRIMGIEENFATQVEETQRLENERGEKFYRRQVDNYASLERQTQTLTQVFGALEDKLSGILGVLGSNRIATSAFQQFTSPFGGGDPQGSTSDASTTVPTYGGAKPLNEIKNMSSFKNMNPKMQDRVLRMMRDNPNVGFGQGVRSSQAQRAMFMQRYRRTDKETNAKGKKNIYWDGSHWEHVSGAPAAPPGRSMHEVGLAADLVGDLNWVVQNAHKYGLKHFKDVNGEAWHVQPAELPNSRKAYEESGSKWGGEASGAAPFDRDSDFADELDRPSDHGGVSDNGTTFGNPEPYGLSISQRVAESITGPMSGQTGVAGGGKGTKVNKKRVDPTLIKRGKLTGEQVALLLHKSGFRGEDIVKGVAISHRESRWNSNAHNPNRGTGDNSYGLFQINMIEKYAAGRRKSFGIASDEDLFNPEVNVRAAKNLYDGRKNARQNPWHDWGPYKGKSETYDTNMPRATQIVNSIDFGGDPMGSASTSRASGGSGDVSVTGGATFNIAPTININGSASSELQKIAKDLALMVRKEIELEILRSN
jgi:hypothetical protein